MSDERLELLIARCARLAERWPRLYRLGAVALAGLGLGYVVFWVLLALGLGLLCLLMGRGGTMKLGVALIVLAFVLGRALWVKFEPLEGRRLTREQVPALFAVLDELRALGRVPPISEVILDDAFNASMVQRPRFGLLGGTRNYLIVGLPYLLALSPEQFRAVLAHELGHLAGAHGRLGAWIYRVRTTWRQLLEIFEKGEARLEWLFRPFLRWYEPRLNAYTFALRRRQEIEADVFSAETAGAQHAAEALVVASVVGRHLRGSFWPALNQRPAHEPEPPALHREMQRAFRSIPPAEARNHLSAALAEAADPFDTHPSLAERLAALGQPAPALPPVPTESAADRYLGEALAELGPALDHEWSWRVLASWRQAHQQARAGRERLAELDARHARGETLDDGEAFERADLVEDHRNVEEALALFRALVARSPRHALGNFALGRMLLARGDGAGIGHLEVAMAEEPEAIPSGCGRIIDYLESVARADEAAPYRARLEAAVAQRRAAQEAREGISQSDHFVPHELDDLDLAAIVEQLRRIRAVRRAWLVRKELEDEGPPIYLLAFERRWSLWRGLVLFSGGWWILSLMKDPDVKLRERLVGSVAMPDETYVLALKAQSRTMRERIRAVPGALIVG